MMRVSKPAFHALSQASTKRPSSARALLGWTRDLSTAQPSGHSLLTNTQSFLRNLHNDAEIFLVGTAHVSKASAEEVRAMIKAVKPEIVFVELDVQRARQLQQGSQKEDNFLKDFLTGLSSPFKLPGHIMEHGIKALYKTLKTMGLDPGLEFKVALEEAQLINARIVYGDQDQATTTRKLADAVSFKDIFKLMSRSDLVYDSDLQQAVKASGGGLAGSVEAMKTRKAATAIIHALRQTNPALAKVLIDDRDKYMVERLRQLRGRVVGVVGLGHLDGIERLWEQANTQRLSS